MQKPLLINIAGIFTGRTDPDWKDRFTWYLESEGIDVAALNRDYWAGAFAPWTHWVVNPRAAREILSYAAEYLERFPGAPVHIVAHSNGTNVALLVAKGLRKLGYQVETMILIGAAIDSDVSDSGLHELLWSESLGKVIAYCSPDDGVIRPILQRIPGFWGALGSTGFTRGKDPERRVKPTGLRLDGYEPLENGEWGRDLIRIVTRWFPRYGHNQWLNPPEDLKTFRCLLDDLHLSS